MYRDPEKQKQAVKEWKQSHKHKAVEYTRKWKNNNPDKTRGYYKSRHLKKKYGITLKEFELKIKSQNNVCPICKCPLDNGEQVDMDHCHTSNKNREVLHNKCNRLISCCREDISILENAIKYLEKYGAGFKPKESLEFLVT